MNKMHLTEEETLLIQWIRKTRLSPAELMLTTQMLRRAARGTRGRQQCVELGIQAWREMKRTVSFKTCVEESLKARAHRRPRTLGEIRSVSARMMREWPALQGKMMRSLRTEDCRAILSRFPTPGGMRKARVILHGICAFACRRGWAGGNPVEGTFAPAVIEKKIPVLMPEECGRLIRTAQKEYDGACLPAAVLMLYAGVRPQEVRRLRFRHLRLENGELIIPSTHSKTGGSRLVTLQPVALRFLRSFRRVPPDTFICPKGWERKWREVRVRAGWNKNHPWAQDILRHTFASYHAAACRDYTALQWEMGHRDGRQLRTRYMNMDSIGRKHAALFWKGRERQYERRSLNINQNGFFG